MENNEQYRNMTLSLKVTAAQKAEYIKIASSLDLSTSEWLSSIIEMNKNSFEKIGDPTNVELKLGEIIETQKKEIQDLKIKLTIAEEQKGIELKSNHELRHQLAEWTVYGRTMKKKYLFLDEELLKLNNRYAKICKNIDDFADQQDGYVFFNWLNIEEIKRLKD